MFHLRTLALLLGAFITTPSPAQDRLCTLTPLSIAPLAGRNDVYVGHGRNISLEFRNEKNEGPVDVFPEPPLVIYHRPSGSTCAIEGGVWVRHSVFISADEKVIITLEFSGSNDSLNFYDTSTCGRFASIDVSGARWEISTGRITVSHGPGTPAKRSNTLRFTLDTACRPHKQLP